MGFKTNSVSKDFALCSHLPICSLLCFASSRDMFSTPDLVGVIDLVLVPEGQQRYHHVQAFLS